MNKINSKNLYFKPIRKHSPMILVAKSVQNLSQFCVPPFIFTILINFLTLAVNLEKLVFREEMKLLTD